MQDNNNIELLEITSKERLRQIQNVREQSRRKEVVILWIVWTLLLSSFLLMIKVGSMIEAYMV